MDSFVTDSIVYTVYSVVLGIEIFFRYPYFSMPFLIPDLDTHFKKSLLFDTNLRYQYLSIDPSLRYFSILITIFEIRKGNFCMTNYYFLIKLNHHSSTKHQNES